MTTETIELPDGDPAPLLAVLAGARFVNVVPGVDAPPSRSHSPISDLFRSRGPEVPLGTWTPEEIGIQHATGTKAMARLAEAGVALPEGWRPVQDHPRRGLVVRPLAGAPADEVIGWLLAALEVLNPLPVVGPWQASVRR